MQGGFSPLAGYMNEADYLSVVENMTLASGLIFGLPVVYDTNDDELQVGERLLLKHGDANIAVFDVQSKYSPNKPREAMR